MYIVLTAENYTSHIYFFFLAIKKAWLFDLETSAYPKLRTPVIHGQIASKAGNMVNVSVQTPPLANGN